MLKDTNVPCSEKQKNNELAFKKTVFNFRDRNPRYSDGHTPKGTMSLELLLEVIDILRDPHDRSDRPPSTGSSGDNSYTSANWKNFVWPHIVVINCDYNSDTGKMTNVLFTTTYVHLRAEAAIELSPGNKVQLEVDYFTPKGVNNTYHVGNVGFSDYSRFYWPLFYQIAVSENQEVVHQLLKTTIDFLEFVSNLRWEETVNDGSVVNVILADGGTAILAAINQLSDELKAACNDEERERLHYGVALPM